MNDLQASGEPSKRGSRSRVPLTKNLTIAVRGSAAILICLGGLVVARPAMPADWVGDAGGGVISAPRSIGSGRQLTIPVPVIEARYHDWFFATDNPVTVYTQPDPIANLVGCKNHHKQICVAVIERSGHVRRVLTGSYTKELAAPALEACKADVKDNANAP